MLASFRGMPQFDWMTDIIRKLKRNIKSQKINGIFYPLIQMSICVVLIDSKELFNFIINEQPIKITYEPFGKSAFDAEIHPYYLKQYNNRWFILGYNPEYKDISVLHSIESKVGISER